MGELSFTAGLTLQDDTVLTVELTQIDASGMTYHSEDGPHLVPWDDVKAVMLATPEHMLESGGYLFSMAEMVREREQDQPYHSGAMRRFGLGLLQQAAPRICPLGIACGLRSRR